MYSELDHQLMSEALAMGRRALLHATPNPRVGCVIARDGRVIGAGFTQPPGSNHAEVEALLDARKNGHDVHGATAYVTLEPCAHFGRTPPCASALIEAHIGRVIAAVEDPNPLVGGRGLRMLRDAGIDVRCGLLEQEAIEANLGFFARMNRGRPWVRLKIAASLDGRTALLNGVSQWITSETARADGHAWRARSCAVATGIGTLKSDDPQLTARLVETPRQPLKVLVDSRLDAPPTARLFHGAPVLVACAVADPERRAALEARGAEVVVLPDAEGKVDLAALMRELGRRGVNELLVEGGAKLNGSLIRAGVVDELLVYLAPMLIGDAAGMAHLPALADLGQARRMRFHDVSAVGEDVRLLARFTPQNEVAPSRFAGGEAAAPRPAPPPAEPPAG
jgi:diaminohydroxyphosphoribosylaminopyrimidine deaminase/5-amino-6-(5-phosphoribosylamino)uracil reductase